MQLIKRLKTKQNDQQEIHTISSKLQKPFNLNDHGSYLWREPTSHVTFAFFLLFMAARPNSQTSKVALMIEYASIYLRSVPFWNSNNISIFSFDVQLTKLNYFRLINNASGVVSGSPHIEDLPFIFKTPLIPETLYDSLEPDSQDVFKLKQIREYFTNFVIHG